MTQIFFDILGKYATVIIDFYRENQTWLNIIVLIYGILLALAHHNVKRLELHLQELTGVSDMNHIWHLIQNDKLKDLDLEKFKKELRIPILSSPYHFYFYSVTSISILHILQKKYPGSS
ncbi:MAG: hypothetical protein DRP70_07360 [Spirochaetes bacterium]|nr:MAG: hypothetical protein DRP70_07360 [Spirochaetota bacterium]RKX95059.1 MAG: hypothetical protein DRZ90_10880 [Spirochaetota bacterium]